MMELTLLNALTALLIIVILTAAYGLYTQIVAVRRVLTAILALAATAAATLTLLAVLPTGNFYGPVINTVPTATPAQKVVALTYDDGPYPPYTEALLQVLAKENVRATFFMVGRNAQNNEQTVHQVAAAGHTIGLHTQDHIDLLKLDKAQKEYQLRQGRAVLERLSGQRITLFRPPHGFRDWQVIDTVHQAGMQTVNWSAMSKDWLNPTPEVIAERTLQAVKPGAIILLHDGDSPYNRLSRENTVAATELIIKALKAQGYTFVTL